MTPNPEPGLLFVVCSPSGAGKTTLCRRLIDRFGSLRFSVSHTTRKQRPGEVDGRDYHFVEEAVFVAMEAQGEFVESAHVHGNRYGTSYAEIHAAAAGGPVLFDVDFQGAAQIRRRFPDAVATFILPPSLDVLRARLERRGTETPDSLELRFRNALREIEAYPAFDYLVVNDDLTQAVETLVGIFLAESSRRHRQASRAEQLLGRPAGTPPGGKSG